MSSSFNALERIRTILLLIAREQNESAELVAQITQKLSQSAPATEQELQNLSIDLLRERGKDKMIVPFQKYCQEQQKVYQRLVKEETQASQNKVSQILVGPNQNDEYLPWSCERIAKALEREANIPHHIAWQVAEEVEKKVLFSGYTTVTTNQIRELANSELFLQGHHFYLQKQSIIGIPKYDFHHLLYKTHAPGSLVPLSALYQKVLSKTFRQYALEEVFSQAAVQAHLSGDIHIECLDSPASFFTLCFQRGQSQGNASELLEMAELLADLEWISSFASHFIDLYLHPKWLLLDNGEHFLAALLRAISHNFTRPPAYRLIFPYFPLAALQEFITVYQNLQQQNHTPYLPEAIIQLSEEILFSPHLSSLCQLALQSKKIVFALQTKHFFDPAQTPAIRCVIDSIVLNLARVAAKAQFQPGEPLEQQLTQLFNMVVKTHLDKKRFLQSLAEGPLQAFFQIQHPFSYSLEESYCFLELSGLPEMTQLIAGEDICSPQGRQLAMETLRYLEQLCQQVRQKHQLRVKMVDYSNHQGGTRFARIDSSRFVEIRDLLEKQNQKSYASGVRLSQKKFSSAYEQVFHESQFHPHIPSAVRLSAEVDLTELKELLITYFHKKNITALRLI